MVLQVRFRCVLVSLVTVALEHIRADLHNQLNGQNEPHDGEVDVEKVQLPRILARVICQLPKFYPNLPMMT